MCCALRVDRPAASLPEDVDALRALALEAIAERDAAIAERDRLMAINEKLRQLLLAPRPDCHPHLRARACWQWDPARGIWPRGGACY
jgi:hypothetical protein